jgi:AAA ATPase-like protein
VNRRWWRSSVPRGIGKTALVERFGVELGAVRVPRASCDEAGALLSYGAVAQLRRSAGPAGRDLPAPAADEPVAVGLRLLDVLGELQEAGPVVVVLDDAAWADPPSAIAIAIAPYSVLPDHTRRRSAAVPDTPARAARPGQATTSRSRSRRP